jgi:adenylosuccinate lyase
MIPRYTRAEMAAIWTDEERFRIWLEVETSALEAFVKLGLAPENALSSVKQKASFSVERILEIEKEVKHDVIAFLTNVGESVGDAARYLHLGMTSSDLLDTAFAVQLCRATDLILSGLETLLETVKKRAIEHKDTVCIGRSHGIHAEPTTFGLKVAIWYAELKRQRKRILAAREDIAVGAISGAVGTYAHLDPAVEAHVCKRLGLVPAPVSTQVIQRDIHAALFLSFAQLAATIEKIALEVRHLQRTEVREAEEFFSKGQKGSSAMPHKRNPIISENICGLSRLVRAWAESSFENIPLWHERDISHSSVERVVAPDITITVDFMLARVNSLVQGLQVYPENMKRNLELTKGLIFSGAVLVALTEKGLKREDAYKLVQKHALATWDELNAGNSDVEPFTDRMRKDEEVARFLSKKDLDDLFSLDRHLAQVDFIFGRVFA